MPPLSPQVPCPSVFGEPSKELSIIIPAYNEEDRLPATLTETLRCGGASAAVAGTFAGCSCCAAVASGLSVLCSAAAASPEMCSYLQRRRDRQGAYFTYEVGAAAAGWVVPAAWRLLPRSRDDAALPDASLASRRISHPPNRPPLLAPLCPTACRQVIIVDDGSQDGTVRAAAEFVRKHGFDAVRVLRLPRNRGKGYAVKSGMLCSRGQRLLMMDADGATKVSDLEKLEARLAQISSECGCCCRTTGVSPGSTALCLRALRQHPTPSNSTAPPCPAPQATRRMR